MAEASDKPKAPYVALTTFLNFLNDLAKRPDMLPPRIDKTLMKGMSGGTQSQLVIALRFFGLVEGDNDATADVLRDLVKLDEDGRKARLGDMLAQFYPEAMALSAESGTAGALSELFTKLYGSQGSTKDKAIRFFLQLAQHTGTELSPHFAVPRATTTPRKKRKASPDSPDTTAPPPPPQHRNARTVPLRSGGSVTLSYDVDLFDLTDEDQEFVLGLVSQLRTYENQRALPRGRAQADALEDADQEDEDEI